MAEGGEMNYTKGNIGASGIWEASGNSEIIGIKDAVTLVPICYIKPANWDIAQLIAASPKLAETGSLLLRTVWDTLRHAQLTDGTREALEAASKGFASALSKAEGK